MHDLTVRWIGQNGYLLSDGETEICIDPYLSNVVDRVAKRGRMVEAPFAPEELKSDVVICTHDHLDHVDIDAIPRMHKEKMRFLAPTHAHKTLASCGVAHPIPFDEGAVYDIGAFRLTAVFADHSVPAVGVIVEHGDVTLYFSGDTEYHEKLTALAERLFTAGEIDIRHDAILTNARQHSAATKALEAVRRAIFALEAGASIDLCCIDAEEAMSSLSEIDGRAVSEDIVAQIFSKFCVGK